MVGALRGPGRQCCGSVLSQPHATFHPQARAAAAEAVAVDAGSLRSDVSTLRAELQRSAARLEAVSRAAAEAEAAARAADKRAGDARSELARLRSHADATAADLHDMQASRVLMGGDS